MKLKRLRALLLTIVLALGLCACSNGNAEAAQTSAYQAGGRVTLGSYPQTTSGTDDTPIEWLVLENDGETALLISRYALDCRPYHIKKVDIAWEQCTLRGWLNDEFYNRAFSEEEKKRILTSDVSADENPDYGTNPGKAAKDSVFLLSIAEANKYFADNEARTCAATDYAIRQGADTSGGYKADDGFAFWWLRSPGCYSYYAAYVRRGGSIRSRGSYVNLDNIAVRPCVRVRSS